MTDSTQRKKITIAIDGPSGSGKGTVAKLVAKRLGVLYIDTGAMYRAMALYTIQKGVALNNADKIAKLVDEVDISLKHVKGKQKIFLFGEDVTKEIYTQSIADGASKVAVVYEVRKKLVALQQQIAAETSVVMDGRDIGSYVLPNAELKVYLDADLDERADRRFKQLQTKGLPVDFETVRAELIDRDYRDQTREVSPLAKADDAMYIDGSALTPEQICEQILDAIQNLSCEIR